jgi:hypothetical protein
MIPFAETGFPWIVPAVVGGIIGGILSKKGSAEIRSEG